MIREGALVPCPDCLGDGGFVAAGGPGAWSERDGCWWPGEAHGTCGLCDGLGEVEVCVRCRRPFVIEGGREVCGCASVALPDAA